jgi:pyruvate dehydrogenase E2 component (dihydrolipoamide acetyltransferase)/2-oxoglutarate dehydrogenase E2 component (dihydrolipoamide succinyltransferase)
MASDILIPKLGMIAVEMTLVEWMFGDGERVEKGEIIYPVETDKSTTEIEAQASGIIHPKGEEEIRFQISADHTEADIDEALAAIAAWAGAASAR